MRCARSQPIRNKVGPSDPAQTRARSKRPLKPSSPPVQIEPASLPAIEAVVAEVQLAATTGS
jgi:hypothetical protein